jgi:hypothetical protein
MLFPKHPPTGPPRSLVVWCFYPREHAMHARVYILLFVVVVVVVDALLNYCEFRHYCLVSLMWMKIGSNDITAQVPGVS